MTTPTPPSSPRVAVVGTGYWGKNLVRNFHELGALAAICDSDKQRLEEIGQKYPECPRITSFDEVLADDTIAAVSIATPAETHASLVRRALSANKDVLVEKPLALEVNDAEALVEFAAQRDRIFMVGHLLWYHPAILKLKELIDEGELGRIQYIYSNRLNLGKIRREENILWSFAPHDLSVILGLINEEPCDIHAHGGNYLHQQIADVTVTLLAFPSGVKSHIYVSWLHPFKEQKLVVVGDRRMAVFDDIEDDDKLVIYPHAIEWKCLLPTPKRAPSQAVKIDVYEPLQAECQHFLDCCRDRSRPRTDGHEGLRVLKVLQRCQAALDSSHLRMLQ